MSATPGPSMLYVLSRSVGQSRAAGLASALGLCLGGIVLAVATALGLATVFSNAGWLVDILRYVGSAYLAWLGLGMIRGARSGAQTELHTTDVGSKPLYAIMWQGVVVELLNPKTVLFFALFLPPFVALDGARADVGAQGGSVTLQLLVLGVLVPLTAVPSDLLVAMMGGSMKKALNSSRRARELLAWAGGLTLIGIALTILLEAM
ncbi:LysE family translocator [Albidovulum sediminicola]|uniref:LysE family translocator n=1 Tax=Albidovulum sediminicola TaxID=2984331 RepID=A0ABT2YXZ3_9RHOB|nr:LysE family translocator [Defluviimonas sp. WL0075]MCV2863739.1 LysE family translocator [Defluviimonas sp. WL0075]